jgi:hypothetical protein
MSSVLALWVEFVYVFKRRHHRVTYSLCDGSLIPAVVHQKYIRKQIQIHFARERDVGACNQASASYTTTKFCNNIPFIASTLHVHTHAGFMHIYLAVVAFASSRLPRLVATRVVVIWACQIRTRLALTVRRIARTFAWVACAANPRRTTITPRPKNVARALSKPLRIAVKRATGAA